ncbi:MAG TPA: hypothetical protein VFZ78_10555 [Flavisolibacter sp.]
MNRNTIMTVLVIVALVCVGYAIYRSTGERIVITNGNTQTSYNDPQHGLILGLCIFAGLCIIGVIAMVLDKRSVTTLEERSELSRRTL